MYDRGHEQLFHTFFLLRVAIDDNVRWRTGLGKRNIGPPIGQAFLHVFCAYACYFRDGKFMTGYYAMVR